MQTVTNFEELALLKRKSTWKLFISTIFATANNSEFASKFHPLLSHLLESDLHAAKCAVHGANAYRTGVIKLFYSRAK